MKEYVKIAIIFITVITILCAAIWYVLVRVEERQPDCLNFGYGWYYKNDDPTSGVCTNEDGETQYL